MRNITLWVLILITGNLWAQNAYTFKPIWKVGDKRTVTTYSEELDFKNGELTEETLDTIAMEVKVLKETSTHYQVQVLFDNVALRSAITFYDKMGEELKDYRKLDLRYEVDKNTGEAALMNWKEASDFMMNSIEQIDKLLKKRAPEIAEFSGIMWATITPHFKSKESMEAYMSDNIDYLIIPFNKEFVPGDTLVEEERGENPFQPGTEISISQIFFMDNIKASTNTCDIHNEVVLDLAAFKEMMKSMMQGLGESFGIEDSSIQKKNNELDDIQFDMTNHRVITFNRKTGWPEKVEAVAVITAGTAGDLRERKLKATTIIR